MDKRWRNICYFFIHKASTDSGHIAVILLVEKVGSKFLILLVFIKLCTGKAALNNNNKISISNIY